MLMALHLLKSPRRLAATWARQKGSGEEINSIDPELYLIFAGTPRQLWSQRGVGGHSSGDRICGQELRGPGLRLRQKCPLPVGRAPRESGACRPGIGRLAGRVSEDLLCAEHVPQGQRCPQHFRNHTWANTGHLLMAGAVAGDTAVNKIDKAPPSRSLHYNWTAESK